MKEKQNTDNDKVWVNSRTYKGHYRAKRGSKSEAKLNDSLAQSARDIQQANLAAKLIKASLDPFRENFMGGLIWHDLVGLFKKQLKNKEAFHVKDLKDKDIWKLYPLSRFRSLIKVSCCIAENRMDISLTANRHPDFKRTFTDAYRISLLAIYPDFEKMEVREEGCISGIIRLNKAPEPLHFTLPVPLEAKQYMLIMKLEGMSIKSPHNWYENVTIKAMKVITAGDL